MRSLGKFFWDAEKQKFNFDSEEAVKAMQIYIETPVKKGIETQLDDHHMNSLFAGKVGVAMGNTAMAPEGAKLKLTDGTQMKVETVNTPPAIPGQKTLYRRRRRLGLRGPDACQEQGHRDRIRQVDGDEGGPVNYVPIYGGVVPSTPAVLDDPIYQGDDIVKISRRRAMASLPDTVYYGNDWGLNRTGTDVPFTKCRQGAMTAQEACKASAGHHDHQLPAVEGQHEVLRRS